MAGRKFGWIANVTAYTAAGAVASMAIGAVLGWLGEVFLPAQVGGAGIVLAIGVAALVIARELEWVAVPLPQLGRQTHEFWARMFPGPVAAALWGFDLGRVFTTWLTFSGVWLLVVVAVLVGEPTFGAFLFAMHWLGRALSVWLAPWVSPDEEATPDLMDEITEQHQLFRGIHVMGIAGAAIVLILWFANGLSM